MSDATATTGTEAKGDPTVRLLAKEVFRAMMAKGEPPMKPGSEEYKAAWVERRKEMLGVARMALRRMNKAGYTVLVPENEKEVLDD